MTTDEHEPGQAAEVALQAAAESLHEQLDALDQAVSYHEQRARELRETRKRVARVEAIVNAPHVPDGRRNNGTGPRSEEARRVIAQRTKRRHAEERQAKKDRLRVMVRAMGPGVDIAAADLLDEFNAGTPDKHDPGRLGRQLAVDLLRELRDEGTLRLDHTGNGAKAYYRLVGHDEPEHERPEAVELES